LCSHSRISQHFMETKGSLPHSQELSTCPYPEPDQSCPYHPILSARSIKRLSTHSIVVSFPLAFPPITYKRSFLPYSCYIFCSSHPPHLDCSSYTWRRVQSRSFSLCSFLHSPVTSSLFGSNILISTLFSNILSLCYYLNVRDRVSHP
jgi:hypothetical protein